MAMHEPGRTKGFPCKQCGNVYSNMPSLLEHMDAHHQQDEDRRFKCDECGRGYRHAGSLANHRKTHDVGSFQCQICGRENSNALALKSHLRSHTSQKKYTCEECGKSFRLASQLATHERVHLSRQVRGVPFRRAGADYEDDDDVDDESQDLVDEIAASVGVSPDDSHSEEDEAGVSYNEEAEGSEDAGNRPHKCDLCDKSYIHHRSLTYHKKTHQVGMFECTVCLKQFNNMAALASHQRSHRTRGGADPGAADGPYADAQSEQFSPRSGEAPVNFCHLCQVLFPNDKEFQEHIQMHNSSSMSFGHHDLMPDNRNVSYDNSIASPESNFYASPVNNIPSVSSSSMDNHGDFDKAQERIMNNGHMYSDCSANRTASNVNTQGEPSVMAGELDDIDDLNEMEEDSATESGDRRFKCNVCGKSYRHSGSLINHKRSHQVGIYQCSICRKSYPHLAALKSHLRLHKAQPSSFNVNNDGDWLSSEPLTLDSQQGCLSSQEDDDDTGSLLGLDRETAAVDGAPLHEQFDQDFAGNRTVHLPHDEHLMQRHMCADCGETFADIAGIKSHGCPLLLQQQHAANGYGGDMNFHNGNGQCAIGNPGNNVEFQGLNGSRDQSYFSEQSFQGDMSGGPLNGICEGVEEEEEEEEEEDDGELYQCSVCGNRYTSQRALKSHLRGHTQAHGTPASSGPSSMSSHEEQKDDEAGEMVMICSTCGESFAKRQDLLAHQLLHKKARVDDTLADSGAGGNEEAESIICGGCGIFCSSYRHLQSHGCCGGSAERKEAAGGREKVKVNEAVAVARGEEEAAACMKENVDHGDRQYKCDQCGRTYRHAGSLLNHKKSHKTGVFRCLVCQKRFYNLLALKNHQRSHFDVKRHTCHECGKAFKIQKQLLTHLRRHKENQAKIQELNDQIKALMQMNGPEGATTTQASSSIRRPQGKTAKAKSAVKSEGTGDLRPFSCDQCGRTYRHAGSLFNHMNSHKTGEYCCSVCNNTYSNQLAMKNHLRTHFSYKRHTCQNCGRGFRGKKQLSSHVCGHLRKEGAVRARAQRTRAFKCKACKQAFPSVDQLAGHVCAGPLLSKNGGGARRAGVSMKKEERPYTCSVCSRTYRHAGSLLNHKNTHKTGHFSCTFCSKPFTNPMALRNHTRIHTQKKKYVCLTCGKAFRLASILHNHQKTHSRAASHFSCPACGKSFHGKSGLKRHRCQRAQGGAARAAVQRAEGGDKCFMCDLCGRSYRHAGSLLNHKKSHSESLHHCALCLQTFPDPLTLQIHSQMKRHCCPVCGKTFCLLAHLQSHMEVHKDRPVVCSPCQQSFPTAASYQQHQDAHHGAQGHYHHHQQQQQQHGLAGPANSSLRWDSGADQRSAGLERIPKLVSPYSQSGSGGAADPLGEGGAGGEDKSHVCEHCGRAYRHAGSLLNHKNSHKTGSFYCAVCQKEFTNLMALKNHRRIHTEPKRYQCLECGKAFRVSTQLICHRRIHTKEKPFGCLLCDKSFSSKSNLRHHQKMHQNAGAYDSSSFSMDANTFMDLDMGSFL